MNLITNEKIDELILSGSITKRKHPKYDIYILNYTPEVQYSNEWTPDLLMCRGLVVDSDANIVARPFEKFFNYSEEDVNTLPNEPYEVYLKMDGSLGILFNYNDEWIISTRGSFESEQAIHATEILNTKYKDVLPNLNKELTYLFEIIY